MSILDPYDIKLLKALQEEGRLTNQELAGVVNLSPSQCSRRRARLEEMGLIAGYFARLDQEKLGFSLTVFINVMLNTHNRDNATKFAALLSSIPNVLEAHALTGEMDYQVKMVVRDLAELSSIINDRLMPHESVQTLKSSIVLDTIKLTTELPLS